MRLATLALSLPLLAIASCGSAQPGDSAPKRVPAAVVGKSVAAPAGAPFKLASLGAFDEPWALAIEPGTGRIFITEKPGTMKVVDPVSGRTGSVGGTPKVAYGGQGGFADVAFAPDYKTSHAIYISWVEAGSGGNRGGVAARGTLTCPDPANCHIDGLKVIWRQQPQVSGTLQFALRLTFSPDGKYLFVASGDRSHTEFVQKFDNNLGKILRLLPDGKPAPGNPFASKGHPADEIWTIGQRNPLGLRFDLSGQLWDVDNGPAGGDDIDKLKPGDNYGWPVVSEGDNYNGTPIPRPSTHPRFHTPAIFWNPDIAPGGFVFYSGKLWPEWKGQAIVTALRGESLVRVSLRDDRGTEVARYAMSHRMRDVLEAPDGSLYAIEDGNGGRLLHLMPK